jgi:hypothetical protein
MPMFRGIPLPPFSFGNQSGANVAGTNSIVGGPDEKMRQLMEMLRRFNPRQAGRGFADLASVQAGGLPGTEGA